MILYTTFLTGLAFCRKLLLHETNGKNTPISAFLFPKSFCSSLNAACYCERTTTGTEWVPGFRYCISLLVGELLHNLHLNRDSLWFHFAEIKFVHHTSQQKLSNTEVPQDSLIHTTLELTYPFLTPTITSGEEVQFMIILCWYILAKRQEKWGKNSYEKSQTDHICSGKVT